MPAQRSGLDHLQSLLCASTRYQARDTSPANSVGEKLHASDPMPSYGVDRAALEGLDPMLLVNRKL